MANNLQDITLRISDYLIFSLCSFDGLRVVVDRFTDGGDTVYLSGISFASVEDTAICALKSDSANDMGAFMLDAIERGLREGNALVDVRDMARDWTDIEKQKMEERRND